MAENRLSTRIGQQISLPGHFDVPVCLEHVRALGADGSAGYECRVRLPDGTLEETVISPAEAASLCGTDQEGPTAIKPVDAERLRLLIESARIRLAYAHDHQFAVSLSGIRTLPHQIEAVYQVMLPQPRLRFLLADDPGAGKTIMAGLLIKELKLRGAIERVLILCPAPLTIQWQDEMLQWFGESFDIISSAVDQQQLGNPWQRSSQVIASIDYAKQNDVRERVWQQRWDLVVIDEAHKCSAYTKSSSSSERSNEVVETKRYQLVKRLSEAVDNVLLITATPHHGNEDRFSHFLRLIDLDLFPEPHRFGKEAAEARREIFRLGKGSPWCLRRLKEDLKDLNGKRLFSNRLAKTVTFRLNSEEYALYKSVTDYINKFIPHQSGKRGSSAALTRTVLQRRLVSSTCAIHESLKRRLKKQQDLLDQLAGLSPAQRANRLAALQGRLPDAEQDEDDLDNEVRDRLVDEYTAALELEQLRAEIAALKELVEQARKVRELANDSKLAALKKCLGEAQFVDLKDGRGKLLVFTEHRDTLNYVREHLKLWDYSTCEIHGGMNPHERKRAQEQFRTTAQICVATEAAGEGINLQFCHLMINYDMPWNPTRLEQRLGRIHRIGQDRDVYAFNFVATDSEDGQPIVEGRILHRLLEKLDTMNEALEGRVFDVIGEVLSLNDVNLPDMLREAAYDPRRLDEYLDQIDRIDPAKLKEYEEATGIALARNHVDFTGFQRHNLEVEEKRLMPRYVETQFIAAAKEVGLHVEPRADGLWRIEHVLADLRSERLRSVQRLGKPDPSYRKVTFHKHHLEQAAHVDAVLMGPGHPLYAAVDEKLNEKLAALQGGIGFYVDPLTTEPYRLHFFEITIRGKDSRGSDVPLHGELVAVREQRGQFEIVPSDILLNLPPQANPPSAVDPVDTQAASDFLKSTYQLECRARCQEERQRFARICREYLERSFDVRIKRAQERAMLLAAEATTKPEYKLSADEARKYVEELQRQRRERLSGLGRLEIARTGPVRHVATAIVLAAGADTETQLADLADELDPNVRSRSERAAEDLVVTALKEEGFPGDRIERVGHLKLGFDIRAHRIADEATGEVLVKRVEVKGRARGQPVRLTTNEWYKAQQLAETYWLYVVWDPLGPNPELVRIQNPAVRLDHAKRQIVAARFFEIPAEAVVEAGRAYL
ncbi:helicase Snf2/Rad54 family [Thermosynechococcus sp. NK55a]|uniref:helicase-related protein n=1 Tax=Thermosynechococcus sp. NK55a TaxID=1394889 RepID=UPI0003D84444|nr:helicase-related protein [Thermosynechococcus sp. NK55a]AHB89087.1 helicase Snf2/Rad54 family [Thermosynechococcus sp. NK55a]